ncbi:MAG: FecR domain-containing protein [Gemmatimonadota bacterium]|nr:FecR domain-containing protein [Gemmatimonadota bacterium]
MTDQQHAPFDPSDADWDALAQFLAGEGTAEERAATARLLDLHPSRGALMRALSQAVRADEPVEPNAAEVEEALVSVRARAQQDLRIAEVPRRAAVVSLDTYRSRWRGARFAAAAAVLVVAGGGLLARIYFWSPAPSTPGALKNYATAPGVMDSLTLPDGSRVLLGAGSRLSVAAGFGSPTREMTLVGEARFTVVHDAAHDFVIHTSAATVRDVGTVFSVHSDEAEGARVVVSEGAVEVREKSGASRQTLGAGDVAVVAPSGGIQVQRAAAGADDAAWTQGRLVFRDASVAQVTADLRRWYGVEVRVDSSLAKRPVTASFDRGLSAADVARIVAATIGGTLREEGGVLHIVSLQAGATAK